MMIHLRSFGIRPVGLRKHIEVGLSPWPKREYGGQRRVGLDVPACSWPPRPLQLQDGAGVTMSCEATTRGSGDWQGRARADDKEPLPIYMGPASSNLQDGRGCHSAKGASR